VQQNHLVTRDANPIALQTPRDKRRCDVQQDFPLPHHGPISRDANPTTIEIERGGKRSSIFPYHRRGRYVSLHQDPLEHQGEIEGKNFSTPFENGREQTL